MSAEPWPMDDRMREQDRATAEAFADPQPGDRFHEMYSWWVVVVEAGDDGVKVMCAGGPTNITRGQFHDGEIVEPFADRAEVRWYATAGDFRAAYSVRTMPGHYAVMLADRGKIDVTGWLERAKELPAAPTHPPRPAPDPEIMRKHARGGDIAKAHDRISDIVPCGLDSQQRSRLADALAQLWDRGCQYGSGPERAPG